MSKKLINAVILSSLSLGATSVYADESVTVTPKNFVRAESDLYLSAQVKDGGLGKLYNRRDVASVQNQTIIRLNRDTLYSSGVYDLDAGPVKITMPDTKGRFQSLQVISEDHYTPFVIYDKGTYVFNKENIGTRYVLFGFRTLVNPNDPKDVNAAHAVQDQIKIEQANGPGKFEIPKWDLVSQKKVRDALLVLSETLSDTNGMFGKKNEVDPVLHLIGSASAWGGNPETEATYLNITPKQNDGKTVYKLSVKDVPVDEFWSVSVYNEQGYYQPNELNSYNLNSVTAQKAKDGSITIQFGACNKTTVNCIPIVKGWNYMVRLYRPQASILNGTWHFPEAQPIK
ncbi:DUF1254 domain-containing protein [Acinetobacter sp. S40]|uniref:DUF1214 domain-containing protein n=1 Tax=unclassified Acinetobacter TaxID=196816 RepID=UPI00190DB115|nr:MULTISPECIES: DUF1214 domain-containing protein [unclassified Acinetobacter]MBJ9984171.1 DUF1254 domain-containing protein [Acinetobacter sp. S40]MBK0062779.1 DUF1254 domain-containing protein [Acinetobacter sp. S55]MBK0065644.1 DUF1254 domain-containing protein [Acinetobacter sp. S54]